MNLARGTSRPVTIALQLIAVLLALLVSGTAFAEDPEELFQQGLQLMREAKFVKACPKLRRSHELDPRSGTLISLGFCHESLGMTASAWRDYREAIELAKKEDRPKYVDKAIGLVAKLLPQLPRLRIHAPKSGKVTVQLDGLDLPESEWSKDLPVDPGPHTVVATAPGKKTFTETISASAASVEEVVIPELESSGAIVLPVENRGVQPGPGPLAIAGWATIGVGGAGTVVGLVLGALVLDKKSTVNDECDQVARTCSETGLAASKDGNSLALGSTIAVIAGLATAAVGVTLVVIDGLGDDEQKDPAQPLTPTALRLRQRSAGAMITLEGSF